MTDQSDIQQEDALEFFEEVVGGEEGPHAAPARREKKKITADNGRELTIDLVPVDRKDAIDQLRKLPDELLEMFDEVDDPEEVQEEASAANALKGLSGEAIQAFEEICVMGMDHPELTEHHFEGIVQELSLEVLFEMGSVIIDISLQDSGKITGFRDLD